MPLDDNGLVSQIVEEVSGHVGGGRGGFVGCGRPIVDWLVIFILSRTDSIYGDHLGAWPRFYGSVDKHA